MRVAAVQRWHVTVSAACQHIISFCYEIEKRKLFNSCGYSGTDIKCYMYRGADKSLARAGRKQANVSVRMARISFGALPCRGKKTWWQLASRRCWNRARPWHASELVSFLAGLRTYQHPVVPAVDSSMRTFQQNTLAYRLIFPQLWHRLKNFLRCINLGLAFPTTHEEPFPLPCYRRPCDE